MSNDAMVKIPDDECMMKMEIRAAVDRCGYAFSILPNKELFLGDLQTVYDKLYEAYHSCPDHEVANKMVAGAQVLAIASLISEDAGAAIKGASLVSNGVH